MLADLGVAPERVIRVFNKSDLVAGADGRNGDALWISAATGAGVDELKAELARRATLLADRDGAGLAPGDGRAAAAVAARNGDRGLAGADAAADADPWAWLDAPLDPAPTARPRR